MDRFKPAWWLPGPHAQTIWASVFRRAPRVETQVERIELPDGDFLDLEWTSNQGRSIVLILHGLEGSRRSPYARGMLAACEKRGWRGVLMLFRGCGGEVNRLPRSYHSGETGDLGLVLDLLKRRFPQQPIAAIGFSLGGNVLLKYLGEQGAAAPVAAAVAVSVPFQLANAAARLERGFSRCYQWWLLRSLRAKTRTKFARIPAPVAFGDLMKLTTFFTFDDVVTAPLHGFSGAAEYYHRCSSARYLARIAVPTLIIHSVDDPFMTPEAIPSDTAISSRVLLEVTARGGHNGFVGGHLPGWARYWVDARIPSFLQGFLKNAG
ncbi:MAG: hydrolase [Gammaproteobacteria bacterium]